MAKIRIICLCAFLTFAAIFIHGQDNNQGYIFRPDQEVRVAGLPLRTARSEDPADTLAAALETALHDSELCCGKNSALEDAILTADPESLNEIGNKVQGKYVLDDGRRLTVTAEYLSPNSLNQGQIIASLTANRPLLMVWNSHLYVVYGAIFNERYYYNGVHIYAIHKLLLIDPRFSGTRRETCFDLLKDDAGKVQGLLSMRVVPES